MTTTRSSGRCRPDDDGRLRAAPRHAVHQPGPGGTRERLAPGRRPSCGLAITGRSPERAVHAAAATRSTPSPAWWPHTSPRAASGGRCGASAASSTDRSQASRRRRRRPTRTPTRRPALRPAARSSAAATTRERLVRPTPRGRAGSAPVATPRISPSTRAPRARAPSSVSSIRNAAPSPRRRACDPHRPEDLDHVGIQLVHAAREESLRASGGDRRRGARHRQLAGNARRVDGQREPARLQGDRGGRRHGVHHGVGKEQRRESRLAARQIAVGEVARRAEIAQFGAHHHPERAVRLAAGVAHGQAGRRDRELTDAREPPRVEAVHRAGQRTGARPPAPGRGGQARRPAPPTHR